MPTSSQSLILQTTNGQLPPFFGRRPWKPELPPGPEWTASEYPMSTVQIKHNYTGSETKRYKSNRKPQSLRRAGSAPDLSYKADFSTLPQLLKIRGLHGTVRYDTETKYVSWKINSIGPFYDRMNARRHLTVANASTSGTLRYFHADRAGHSMYNRDVDVPMEYAYRPEFRKQVQFRDPVTFNKESQPKMENSIKDGIFMSIEETEGGMRMFRTNLEKADYFKLIQVKNQSDEINGGEGIELPLFRLEQCRPTEVGCFRLAPTESREVGDYKLVPPPGYLADDFRLVHSSAIQGAFVLLQSDTVNPGQYRPVLRNKNASGEFRMVQAKVQQTSHDQSKMDVIVPREAWGEDNFYLEQSGYEYNSVNSLQHKMNIEKTGENRYNYFDDVRDQNAAIENEYTLPDISLYESHDKGVLHHQPQTTYNTSRDNTFDNDFKAFNQHLDEFNQRYMETLRQGSSREYKRPVHLGFRNANSDCEDEIKTAKGRGASSKLLGSDWKTHNFDQWSRTTNISNVEMLSSANVGITRNVQKMPPINVEQRDTFQEKESLLDEVKFKANYKLWKKKKVTTLRMRKELPPSDPKAVCIRFGDTDLSHDELKAKIEKETGQKLLSLQFDPVSVHSIDPEATSRWIIRFTEASVCENMVENGIRINGIKYQIRKFDDVMKEEHEAYKLYKMMKEYTDRKPLKTSSLRKDIQKPKIVKTTQTQTHKQEIQG
ncbi:uncharacterized protein LOC123552417 [Mercenaria mercenaria]|uniref:uncharacterized protein LOC123552417 n=1 Tax=Mercenaria mercenaria TaxID=6596 RepID=UPI00234F78F1|nr:uncharacterized protein LOC123552417 [Mercenaria mercenaria]